MLIVKDMLDLHHTNYHWLEQDALTVAPLLLGYELLSYIDGRKTGGRIVELEVYHGHVDPASHAFKGQTPRTAPMFKSGGHIYVYFSYGMHTCLNIVTGPAGEAQAILLRALEPTIGMDIMTTRRGLTRPTTAATSSSHPDTRLTSGPGNLAKSLGVTLALSGTHLGSTLALIPPTAPLSMSSIVSGPRVGISKAKDHPWRFAIKDNPFVSRPRL